MYASLRFLALGLLFTLAACAQSVSTDVTRFNQFAGQPMGTFAIEPAAEQEGSLGFTSDAALLSEELQRVGFTPVSDGETPDYLVNYTASQTRFDAGSERGPVDVGVGVGGGSRGTSVGVGLGINLGSGNSNTGYINKLSVTMERPEGGRVFEGHASATSRSRNLPEMMPYLVRGVFTDFPGNNGESDTVKVTLDE